MTDEPEPTEEELEKRLQKLLGEGESQGEAAGFPHPPVDDEIQKRLDALRDKVSDSGRRSMPAPPEFDFKRPKSFQNDGSDQQGYKNLGIGMSAAYSLVGMMGLGFGIGWLFDHGPHSANIGPALGGLTGCVVGIGFVLWLVNRNQR